MKHWLLIGIWVILFQMSCDRSEVKAEVSPIPFLNEQPTWADSMISTLSLEEKLGQLLVYKGNNPSSIERIRLCNAIILGRLGGVLLDNMPIESYLRLIDSVQQLSKVPLLVGSQQSDFLNNQFSDLLPLPSSEVLAYTKHDSLQRYANQLFIQQAKSLGINWSQQDQAIQADLIEKMNQNGILNFGSLPDKLISTENSGNPFQNDLYDMVQAGLSGFHVDNALFAQEVSQPNFRQFLKEQYQFKGLLITDWNSKQLPLMLEAGIDLFVIQSNPDQAIFQLKKLLNKGIFTEEQLDQSIKRILKAKYWTLNSNALFFRPPLSKSAMSIQASIAPFTVNQNNTNRSGIFQDVVDHFKAPEWDLLKRQLFQRSITLANNPNQILPIADIHNKAFHIWEYSRNPLSSFRESFTNYADGEFYRKPGDREGLKAFDEQGDQIDIIIIDNYIIRPDLDQALLESLEASASQKKLIVINFGAPQNLLLFNHAMAIVQIPERNTITESLAAALLFGGFEPSGNLPPTLQHLTNLPGNLSFHANRLIHGLPQEVGIDPKKLVGIDAIVNSAIDGGVIPGAQVLVAKNGKIVYNKAFGYQTYKKQQKVRTEDLYDVASITKVAATTLALMRLVDQKKISLDSKLKDVLDLPANSTLKYITLRKLMIHQSNLQVWMPVGPYLSYRDQPNAGCDSFFCDTQNADYNIKVADNFYFQEHYLDSIWLDVNKIKPYRRRRTRYSDVNFYLLQKVVEHHYKMPLDQVVARHFYHPLGLRHMLFNPTTTIQAEHLIPTEQDKRWRHQLLRGYVHDETSAIMGGVAGHAGLFSNATDLAVVFQMLLDGGQYGNHQLFNKQTIQLFTKKQYGSSRGLGFDKPSSRNNSACSREASGYTFGHTGFTGTCIWADPKEDLIYIFLSNRVHPVARNPLIIRQETRRRIHEVIYNALGTYKSRSLPKLLEDLPLEPVVLNSSPKLETRGD